MIGIEGVVTGATSSHSVQRQACVKRELETRLVENGAGRSCVFHLYTENHTPDALKYLLCIARNKETTMELLVEVACSSVAQPRVRHRDER